MDKQPHRARVPFAPRLDLRGVRVLIVDDNATNREILDHQVLSWGMHNDSASSGPQALELLYTAVRRGEPYDVTILDMHMPGMDGLTLARVIKSDTALASVRLVMLTSAGQYGDVEGARQMGIATYLTKPVRQSELYNGLVIAMGSADEKDR